MALKGSKKKGELKMKTMIAVPCMNTVETEFYTSCMEMQRVGETQMGVVMGSLVYTARNDLAEHAIAAKTDYVLWLDSDVVFPKSLMADLMKDIEGRDIVSAVYHMRREPYKPVLWKKLRMGLTEDENETEDYRNYPKDGIFEIEGCGFGAVLMRTEVLKTVREKYHNLFAPLPGYGEDLSFCIRARGCGYKIHCDPKIQVGHKAATIVTNETWDAYQKQREAMWKAAEGE